MIKVQLDLTSERFLTCFLCLPQLSGPKVTGVRGPPLFGRYTNLTCIVDEGQIQPFYYFFCTLNFSDFPPSLTITNRASGVYSAGPDMLWGWL